MSSFPNVPTQKTPDTERRFGQAINYLLNDLNSVSMSDNGRLGATVVKDVALSNSQSVTGSGQIVSASSGATNLYVLSDYNPRLSGLYISSALNASEAAIRVKDGRYADISLITAVNCGACFINFLPATPSSQNAALAIVSNCDAEGITGTGINIGSSVSEMRLSNVHLYGQLVSSTGGLRPSFTSVGWRQNTPVVGGQAVGGHQVSSVNLGDFNRGFHLTDAQLCKFTNCVADSLSDYGVLIDGASLYIDFSDLFVGTTRGIKVAGTSSDILFDGLRTVVNGAIPPWGSTDFYNGVSTFYDMEVRNTASVRVTNWAGPKRIAVDSTAKLIVNDGETYRGRSIGTVAAATTAYLSETGAGATEGDAVWRVPYDCYIIRLCPCSTSAPGTGQTFTYTARLNFADTALTATIASTAFGNVDSWAGTLIPASKGDQVAIKLVTSATATASRHQVQMQIAPR